ncbi:hypothetical protein [Paraburkholderia azotifigens]|jgi:hypothetical protein|uniref:hypothetical protein n=1 Tax=Paraburkholderia azotifigens TaxID=2057004 RepID=UPI0038BCAF11
MGKIKLIEDGNFPRWLRLSLIVVGIAIFYCTIKFVPPSLWSGLLLMIGFGIALVGGMTSRAALYKIKPFDNSYKKARDSYKVKDDENNK